MQFNDHLQYYGVLRFKEVVKDYEQFLVKSKKKSNCCTWEFRLLHSCFFRVHLYVDIAMVFLKGGPLEQNLRVLLNSITNNFGERGSSFFFWTVPFAFNVIYIQKTS